MTDDEGLVHVPTLPELWREKPAQAEVVARSPKTNEPTHYRAKPEGQARIDAAMHHNAEYLRTHPEVSRALFRERLDKLRNGE